MLREQATRVNDILEMKGILFNASMLIVQAAWNALGSFVAAKGCEMEENPLAKVDQLF